MRLRARPERYLKPQFIEGILVATIAHDVERFPHLYGPAHIYSESGRACCPSWQRGRETMLFAHGRCLWAVNSSSSAFAPASFLERTRQALAQGERQGRTPGPAFPRRLLLPLAVSRLPVPPPNPNTVLTCRRGACRQRAMQPQKHAATRKLRQEHCRPGKGDGGGCSRGWRDGGGGGGTGQVVVPRKLLQHCRLHILLALVFWQRC